MNIYEFRTQGEKEWISAHTLIEAFQYYNQLSTLDIIDFNPEDDVILIPKEDWSNYSVTDPEFEEWDDYEGKTSMTFADWMEQNPNCVDMIATTFD